MPDQSKTVPTNVTTPAYVSALTEAPFTDLQQYQSEVPTGPVASAFPAKIRLTQGSTAIHIRRSTTLATHWLNAPLTDGLLTVSRLYKIIREMAFNYQRTHEDAFFEAYPDLLIIRDNEDHTTHGLRREYRKYAKRLAHYYWEYDQAATLYFASFINMANMTRLNGTEVVKVLASAFKWSTLNTQTNYLDRFPQRVGIMSKMISNASFVVGQNNFAGDFVSLPIYITDVFGARGSHEDSIFNGVTLFPSSARDHNDGNVPNSTGLAALVDAGNAEWVTADSAEAIRLLKNIVMATHHSGKIGDYDWLSNPKNTATPDSQHFVPLKAHSPRVENSSVTLGLMQPTTNASDIVTTVFKHDVMGNDASTYSDSARKAKAEGETDNIIGPLWDSWFYWQQHLLNHFSEMTDPNSDKYQFALNVLKIFEPGMANDKVLAAIRANKNTALADIVPLMTFKKDNAVNTATTVKYLPYTDIDGITANGKSEKALFDALISQDRPDWCKDNIAYNLERYDVDNPSVAEMIAESKRWPGLVPTTFTNLTAGYGIDAQGIDHSDDFAGPPLPVVLNSPYTVTSSNDFGGWGYGHEESDVDPVFIPHEVDAIESPIGRGATFLDLASVGNISPDATKVSTIGVSPEFAKSWTDSNNAIIFQENPTQLFTYQQPLIDNTDPFQCGFNLLISSDDQYMSEQAKWFVNPDNFGQTEANAKAMRQAQHSNAITNDSIIYKDDGIKWDEHPLSDDNAHLTNPAYLATIKHALLFVGSAITMHPLQAKAMRQAGIPISVSWEDPNPAGGLPEHPGLEHSMLNAFLLMFAESPNNLNGFREYFIARKEACNFWRAYGMRHELYGWESLYAWGKTAPLSNKFAPTFIDYLFDPRYYAAVPYTAEINDDALVIPTATFKGSDNVGSYYITRAVKPRHSLAHYGDATAATEESTLPSSVRQPYAMECFMMHGPYSSSQYIPWLLSFKFPSVITRADGTYRVNPMEEVNAAGYDKWPLMLLGDVSIQFTGAKKMLNFWDNQVFESAMPAVPQSGAVPEQNVIAPPREAQASRSAKPSMDRRVPNQKATWRSSSVEGVQVTGGFKNPGSGFKDPESLSSSSSGDRYSGSRHRKRSRSNRRSRGSTAIGGEERSLGIDSSRLGSRESGQQVSETLASTPEVKSTTFTDASSKREDEKVKRSMKSDSDNVRMQ